MSCYFASLFLFCFVLFLLCLFAFYFTTFNCLLHNTALQKSHELHGTFNCNAKVHKRLSMQYLDLLLLKTTAPYSGKRNPSFRSFYITRCDQPRGLVDRVSDYWSWGPGFDYRFCHGDFFLEVEDPHGDHGLRSSVEFRFKAPPDTSHITIHFIGTT
jgi:hypothetical protein